MERSKFGGVIQFPCNSVIPIKEVTFIFPQSKLFMWKAVKENG